MYKTHDYRKVFSISKKFTEVLTILNKVPNMSRFICEAIIEKYTRMQNPCNIEEQVQRAILNFIASSPIELQLKNQLSNEHPLSNILTSNKQTIQSSQLKPKIEILLSDNGGLVIQYNGNK